VIFPPTHRLTHQSNNHPFSVPLSRHSQTSPRTAESRKDSVRWCPSGSLHRESSVACRLLGQYRNRRRRSQCISHVPGRRRFDQARTPSLHLPLSYAAIFSQAYSWWSPPRTGREITRDFICWAGRIALRLTGPRRPSTGIPGPRLLCGRPEL
jgi:hypothetical protein